MVLVNIKDRGAGREVLLVPNTYIHVWDPSATGGVFLLVNVHGLIRRTG